MTEKNTRKSSKYCIVIARSIIKQNEITITKNPKNVKLKIKRIVNKSRNSSLIFFPENKL